MKKRSPKRLLFFMPFIIPFVPKATVRHTVCHKHGLNIPNICGCCNFVILLQRLTDKILNRKS